MHSAYSRSSFLQLCQFAGIWAHCMIRTCLPAIRFSRSCCYRLSVNSKHWQGTELLAIASMSRSLELLKSRHSFWRSFPGYPVAATMPSPTGTPSQCDVDVLNIHAFRSAQRTV
ncbi:hypothetical protein EXIGLDRAFT_725702, partial [Exidia glandulosa HHB12029]